MPRINSIKAGDKVLAGYGRFMEENEFLGFTDRTEKYSSTPKFDTFKDAKAAGMGNNAADVERIDDEQQEYGYCCYALFRNESGSVWGAYVFKGRWSIGSSADPLRMDSVTL